MGSFISKNFDKLLLVFLFLMLCALLIYFVHSDKVSEVVNWTMTQMAGVIGALIALATGGLMARRNDLTKPDDSGITKEDKDHG